MSLLRVFYIVVVSVVSSLVLTKLYWDNYLVGTLPPQVKIAPLDVKGFVDENYKSLTRDKLKSLLDARVADLESQGYVVINGKFIMSNQSYYKVVE